MNRYVLFLILLIGCAAPSVTPTSPGTGSKDPGHVPRDPAKRTPPKEESPKDETLGQCLARKGVHLYGASWCKPCHDQLELFGADAKNVPYTDCSPPDSGVMILPECEAAGIDVTGPFPTWRFADGFTVVGTRSLAWLATSTDCPLP